MALGFGLGIQASKVSFDPAANDFFVRAGITNAAQKAAVNRLVLGLKSANLWTKTVVIYPFVGGSASQHSFNLKSSFFQITWNGTVTHNAAGVTGNGTTGYGDINGAENAILGGATNLHLSAYISTQPAADAAARVTISGGNAYMFRYRDSIPTNSMNFFITGSGIAFTTGFTGVSQTATGIITMQSNATQSTASGTDITLGATSINILRNTTAAQYSDLTHSFISAGSGLSSGDMTNLRSLVQTFETDLGRNA